MGDLQNVQFEFQGVVIVEIALVIIVMTVTVVIVIDVVIIERVRRPYEIYIESAVTVLMALYRMIV